jgi:predicted  nucleic acid-binding Zn-ribbon protein
MNKDTEEISGDAATFTVTYSKEEHDLILSWLAKPERKHMDTDYHNRLEQEVTSLKREVVTLGTLATQLEHDLKQSHAEIASLRLNNEQLRQAIAVLNDEPTNSL